MSERRSPTSVSSPASSSSSDPGKRPDTTSTKNNASSASEDLQGLFVSARRLLDDLNTRHTENSNTANGRKINQTSTIRSAAFLRLENIVERFEKDERKILQPEGSPVSGTTSTPSQPPSDSDTRVNSLNELFDSFDTALDYNAQSSPVDDTSDVDEHTNLLRASCLPAPLQVKGSERLSTASSYETCSVSDFDYADYLSPRHFSFLENQRLTPALSATEPVRVQSWLSSCTVPLKLSLGRDSYQALLGEEVGERLIPLGAIKVYVTAHIHHARTLGLMAPKRKAAKAQGGPAKMRKYESVGVVFSEKSVLIKANLHNYFLNPEAWQSLDEGERQMILSLLPDNVPRNEDGSPSEEFLRYDLNWRRGLRQFQEDLEAGRYDPEWLAEAEEAMQERQAGLFDDWKDNEFEEYWGQKAVPDLVPTIQNDKAEKPKRKSTARADLDAEQIPPPVQEVAKRGSWSSKSLANFLKDGTLKVGDMLKYDRQFGSKATGYVVSATAKILEIEDARMQIQLILNSSSTDDGQPETSKKSVSEALKIETKAEPAPNKNTNTAEVPTTTSGSQTKTTTPSPDDMSSLSEFSTTPEVSVAETISKARSNLRPVSSKRKSMQSSIPAKTLPTEITAEDEGSKSSTSQNLIQTSASPTNGPSANAKTDPAEIVTQGKKLRARRSTPSAPLPPTPKEPELSEAGAAVGQESSNEGSLHWITGVQEIEDIVLGLSGRTFTARPRTMAWVVLTLCRHDETPKTLAQLRDER